MSEKTETKFTDGPWNRIVGRTGDGSARSQQEQLCNAQGVGALMIEHDGSAEGVANAQLASVAPEMYGLLSRLLRLHEESNAAMRVRRNAEDDGCYEEIAGRYIAAMHDITKREIELMAQARVLLKKSRGEA